MNLDFVDAGGHNKEATFLNFNIILHVFDCNWQQKKAKVTVYTYYSICFFLFNINESINIWQQYLNEKYEEVHVKSINYMKRNKIDASNKAICCLCYK